MPHQNMPLWYADYFELKFLKKQPVQEGYTHPSLSPRKQEKYPLCTRRVKDIIIARGRVFRPEKTM